MGSQDNTYPLVSVVVPTYNNETRIACSLESVIAQDYPNIEIIVVNDASTDATEDTARRILESCERPFSVITHTKNRGVSASRNTGMDVMKGEFVWFIDADDMAEASLVSTLYGLIEKYKCDLSFCGLKNRFTDGQPDVLFPVKLGGAATRNGEEMLWLQVFHNTAPSVCGMLFRKKFLVETGLRFHEGCTAAEDWEFQLKVFCRAGQAAYTPDCLYIYVHHAGMGSVRDNNSKDKQIHRYRDHTGSQYRVVQYLREHAPSERMKMVAEKFLLPQVFIRRLTLCARTNDRVGFNALLSDSDIRKTLRATTAFFNRKPEVFLKALALLYFPDIYYRLRN